MQVYWQAFPAQKAAAATGAACADARQEINRPQNELLSTAGTYQWLVSSHTSTQVHEGNQYGREPSSAVDTSFHLDFADNACT